MNSENEKRLIERLDEKLKPYSFERVGISSYPQTLTILAAWKRKTWNTNRAVILISFSEFNGQLGQYVQALKMPLGKLLGFLTFFYPLGLQIVLIGNSILNKSENLDRFLDKFDNQRVVLQSIHVVDLASVKSVSVRTWGQYVTGRFQDAIENGVQTFLNNMKNG